MNSRISRREFLLLGAAGLGGLAFSSWPDRNLEKDSSQIARVAWGRWNSSDNKYVVSVYQKPDEKSTIVCPRYRDEIIHIYDKVESSEGPAYNPYWYRVWRGYIHSSHLQEVDLRLNSVLSSVTEAGQLGEVTVPYTQTLRLDRYSGWTQVYRLYYGSTHWIVGIDEGPDGKAWYVLKDELGGNKYLVDAEHIRPVTPEELAPISPDVPVGQKRIEVSLSQQTLTAFEGSKVALQTKISSGEASYRVNTGEIPTETPTGTFHIENKMPSKHMGDGAATADPNDPNAYELPGVPWVSFFELKTGVACHGTFWHNNFGIRMSHGCINMRNEEAKWLYRWTTPIAPSDVEEKIGYGTQVIVY
jgi:lipoprotein-anchoring transpeptidase ErfK/SrfK